MRLLSCEAFAGHARSGGHSGAVFGTAGDAHRPGANARPPLDRWRSVQMERSSQPTTRAPRFLPLDLGTLANGGAPGAKGLGALDEKLAALLGTGAREISGHRSRRASADAQRLRAR